MTLPLVDSGHRVRVLLSEGLRSEDCFDHNAVSCTVPRGGTLE
jgi:hypothetical protein